MLSLSLSLSRLLTANLEFSVVGGSRKRYEIYTPRVFWRWQGQNSRFPISWREPSFIDWLSVWGDEVEMKGEGGGSGSVPFSMRDIDARRNILKLVIVAIWKGGK